MASTEKGLKIMVTSFVLVLAAALVWALFFGPLAPVDQNARQDVGSVSMPVDKEMRATLTDLNNQFDLEELRMVVREVSLRIDEMDPDNPSTKTLVYIREVNQFYITTAEFVDASLSDRKKDFLSSRMKLLKNMKAQDKSLSKIKNLTSDEVFHALVDNAKSQLLVLTKDVLKRTKTSADVKELYSMSDFWTIISKVIVSQKAVTNSFEWKKSDSA